jgi:hypothetical protein
MKKTLWDDQQRGYKILLDKDGIAAQLPAPTPLSPPPYTQPTQEQFVKRVEGYLYGAVYVAKQIRRGNLWKIKWADQIQQTMLLEMLEWTHTPPMIVRWTPTIVAISCGIGAARLRGRMKLKLIAIGSRGKAQ